MADELEKLEGQAAELDAQAATADNPNAPPEAEAVPVDIAAEVAALIQTAAGILTPAFPSLGTIYTPETCKRLGDAAAPVMEKYGVSVGGLFDRWGAEITLAAVAFPVVIATVQGVKGDLASRRQQPAPQARPVHPGDFVPPHAGQYAQERAGGS